MRFKWFLCLGFQKSFEFCFSRRTYHFSSKKCVFSKWLNVPFFLDCVSNVFFWLTLLKRSKMEFFRKTTFFFGKMPEQLLNLAAFVYKASQRVILLKNTQNDQKMGFFGKVDQFFLERRHTNFTKPINVAYFSRIRFKWIFSSSFLQTIKIWGFMRKNQWFFPQKISRQIQNYKTWRKFSRMLLERYNCVKILITLYSRFFGKIDGFCLE